MLTIDIHQPESLQLECSWHMFMFLDHCKTNPFYLILQQTTNAYTANYCVSVERAVLPGRGHAQGFQLAGFLTTICSQPWFTYKTTLTDAALVQPKLLSLHYLHHQNMHEFWWGASKTAKKKKVFAPKHWLTAQVGARGNRQKKEPREPARQWAEISASDLCAPGA